jgi:hypothetical protein
MIDARCEEQDLCTHRRGAPDLFILATSARRVRSYCYRRPDRKARRTENFALAPRIVYLFDRDVGRMTASATLK